MGQYFWCHFLKLASFFNLFLNIHFSQFTSAPKYNKNKEKEFLIELYELSFILFVKKLKKRENGI